jgi:mRNA interferase MazF
VSPRFGDIVLVAGGTYSSKPRPAVIFQNADYPTGESTVVIPLTSQANSAFHYGEAVAPTSVNGLDRSCWLDVDKVAAIRTAWVGRVIGELETGTA